LNETRGAEYEVIEEPDTKERTRPDIDYLLQDGKTRREIAVEVSSIWRAKDAGKEDAYIGKWFEKVRARVGTLETGFTGEPERVWVSYSCGARIERCSIVVEE
jgi:hypothetical protein